MILVDTINQITLNQEWQQGFIWILLNSKLINWYAYRFILGKAIRTMQFDNPITSRIPIPNIPPDQQTPFITKANLMLKLNKELHQKTQEFLNFIKQKYNLEKITKKLQKFYELDFNEFMKQMNKGACFLVQKISMEEEMELMNLFNTKSQTLKDLKTEIDKQDKIIDEMVFDLYELTEEERKIVLEN